MKTSFLAFILLLKKTLFIGILLFLAVQTKASEPIRWGVVGGMNISKPAKTNYSEGYGFHVGGKAELDLSAHPSRFFIYSAALLSLKGGEPASRASYAEDYQDMEMFDYKEHNYYLNIPVHIGYKHTINERFALFGSVGPYIGLGLFGKTKIKSNKQNSSSNNIYGSNGYLNRFDWGAGGVIGAEITRKIQISLGYDLGLKNVAKTGDYKNRSFAVSCAYMF